MDPVVESGVYTNINSATGTLIRTGQTRLLGIWVSSSTAGTVKIWDNTTAVAPVVLNTVTVSPGWNSMPFTLNTALFVTTGGTIDCTVAWIPG